MKKFEVPSLSEGSESPKETIQGQTSWTLLTIIDKDYRQLFTEKKASFIKTPKMLDVEKKLKQEHQNKCRESSSESIDTLGWGWLVTWDTAGDIWAFIMWFRESVSGHWIRDLGQFGLYHWNTVISKDAYTIRWAKAAEIDHQELDFNEIKILWIENKSIIIWLKSSHLLTIKAISLESNSIQTLKNYDLAQERKDKEKAKLEEELKKASDWKDNLKTANDLIGNQYRGSYDVEKAVLFDDFTIIPVNQYNRNYENARPSGFKTWIPGAIRSIMQR